jgi:hypothetical protein
MDEDLIKILEGAPNTKTAAGLTEHDLNEDQLQSALKYLVELWCSPPEAGLSIAEVAAKRFGLLDAFREGLLVPYGDTGFKRVAMQKQLCIVRLRYHFVRIGLMDLDVSSMDEAVGSASKAMFARIHECLYRLQDTLMTALLARKCLDPIWSRACPAGDDPYNIRAFDTNKLTPNQHFFIFVLEQIQRQGLRRYKGSCYIEIDSPPIMVDGKPRTFKTHSWRKHMEIPEFVNRCAPKEVFFQLWQTSVDGPAKNRTIEQLINGFDIQFPDLVPDRSYHAFHNGIYDTIRRKFYAYGSPEIRSDMTCCKYHALNFREDIIDMEWRDIPTPAFDKILSVQLDHVVHTEMAGSVPLKWTKKTAAEENKRLREDYNERFAKDPGCARPVYVEEDTIMTIPEGQLVRDWAYVFSGRLLHPVNLFDTWQVMPMFVGRAGTGKSLILTTVSKFFNECDVATIANNVQQGFGLETVYDKMMWMIKEVKHNLGLDQGELQSMITGEEMSIMRKGLPAQQVIWRSPGIMAGNELANWSDNSGSMSRRLILFYFMKKVHQSNPRLMDDLNDELPEIMHKANSAYAEACARFGHCDIWAKDPELAKIMREDPTFEYRGSRTILPSYFHSNKNNFKQQTHLMENLLANKDELIVTGKESGRGMPFEAEAEGRPSFKSIANAFFKKQDGKFQWTKTDRYLTVFEDWNIEVRPITDADIRAHRNVFAGHNYPAGTNWIFGVQPKDQSDVGQ